MERLWEEFKLEASADAREQAGPPADEAIHKFVNHGPLADPAG